MMVNRSNQKVVSYGDRDVRHLFILALFISRRANSILFPWGPHKVTYMLVCMPWCWEMLEYTDIERVSFRLSIDA